MRQSVPTGVSLPREVIDKLRTLGGGSLSAGVQKLAEAHFGLAQPPVRLSSSGAVWLETPSFDALAAAIGAGARVTAWPTGLLIADPEGAGCLSIEGGELSWRDAEGATHSLPFELSDLERLCQLVEGSHAEALRRHKPGVAATRPIGGRAEIAGVMFSATAAGPDGPALKVGSCRVPLPGLQPLIVLSELRALAVRQLLRAGERREQLNDLLARTPEGVTP